MNYFTRICLPFLVWICVGCQTETEQSLHDTMQAVSNAIHSRDITQLTPHLSQSSSQTIKEAYEELSKLHDSSTKLPLKDRQALEKKLPPSVVSKQQQAFLNDLLNDRLKALPLDKHTQAGLQIETITQESKTEARVVTKSEQRFAFSLEDGSWKIHLFEKSLRGIIEDTRTANQAIALTLERNAKRRQIESVLHNALKKNKK